MFVVLSRQLKVPAEKCLGFAGFVVSQLRDSKSSVTELWFAASRWFDYSASFSCLPDVMLRLMKASRPVIISRAALLRDWRPAKILLKGSLALLQRSSPQVPRKLKTFINMATDILFNAASSCSRSLLSRATPARGKSALHRLARSTLSSQNVHQSFNARYNKSFHACAALQDPQNTLNSPSELARKLSAGVLLQVDRPDVKKVLVVGSGGLSIGQAGEFDYSGMPYAMSVPVR